MSEIVKYGNTFELSMVHVYNAASRFGGRTRVEFNVYRFGRLAATITETGDLRIKNARILNDKLLSELSVLTAAAGIWYWAESGSIVGRLSQLLEKESADV